MPAIFIENAYIPTPLELNVNVNDPDSADGLWDNAQLTVKIANPEAGDKLSVISLLKVKVSGSSVLYNNVVIGSLSGSTASNHMQKGTDTLCITVKDLNTDNFLGGIAVDTEALSIKVS